MHPYRFGFVLGSIAAALLLFCGQPVAHSSEMSKRRGLTLAHKALIVRRYCVQHAQRIGVNLPSNGAVTQAPEGIRTSDSRFRNAPPQFLHYPELFAIVAYLHGFRGFWCFRFPAQFGLVLVRLQYSCCK